MSKDLNPVEAGVIKHLDKVIARDEQLRELLSYCLTNIEHAHDGAWDAYADVADRLSKILGGEQ